MQISLLSLDAFRGFVMLALASGGLGLTAVARHFPDHPLWQFLVSQGKHAPWLGCSCADLLQPMFLFAAGCRASSPTGTSTTTLWTPSWVLVGGGGAFLALAVFYWLIEVRRYRRWCLPMAGIGRKTLVLYVAFGLLQCFKSLVPPTAWRPLGTLLEGLPHAPHTVMKVYGPLVLTVILVHLLWRVGKRSSLRQTETSPIGPR